MEPQSHEPVAGSAGTADHGERAVALRSRHADKVDAGQKARLARRVRRDGRRVGKAGKAVHRSEKPLQIFARESTDPAGGSYGLMMLGLAHGSGG